MDLNITVWSFLLLLGFIQGLFVCFTICTTKRYWNKRNFALCILLSVFSIIALDHSLRLSSLYKAFPHFIYISDGIWFLIAPTLYFIARFYVQPQYRFRWWDLFHLLPFIIMQFNYVDLLIASADVKIKILEHFRSAGAYGLTTKLAILGMMLQILAYIFAVLWKFRVYEKKYKQSFSSNLVRQFYLLKSTFQFFFVYFMIEFAFSTLRNFTAFSSSFLENWSLVVWVFFIFGITYILIANPSFFLPTTISTKTEQTGKVDNKDLLEMDRIKNYMENKKPFLNAHLTLPDLAKSLKISTNKLSYLINTVEKTNFYDFVNLFRVNEVKRMLDSKDYSHLSIQGISEEAGFRSKTSFYKFFKKKFEKTPSAYIKDNKINL